MLFFSSQNRLKGASFMGCIEKRLETLGITLPKKDRRGKGVVAAREIDGMLYLTAQLPVDEAGKPLFVGRVGTDLTLEQGYQAARQCGLNGACRRRRLCWRSGSRSLRSQGARSGQQRARFLRSARRSSTVSPTSCSRSFGERRGTLVPRWARMLCPRTSCFRGAAFSSCADWGGHG